MTHAQMKKLKKMYGSYGVAHPVEFELSEGLVALTRGEFSSTVGGNDPRNAEHLCMNLVPANEVSRSTK
jgi:hypothetical protein